jgi:hypothetical protein
VVVSLFLTVLCLDWRLDNIQKNNNNDINFISKTYVKYIKNGH